MLRTKNRRFPYIVLVLSCFTAGSIGAGAEDLKIDGQAVTRQQAAAREAGAKRDGSKLQRPLTGGVTEAHVRPLSPAEKKSATGNIQDSAFTLEGKANAGALAQPETPLSGKAEDKNAAASASAKLEAEKGTQAPVAPLQSSVSQSNGFRKIDMQIRNPANDQPVNPPDGNAQVQEAERKYAGIKYDPSQRVTFRLTAYQGGPGIEVAWELFRDANLLVKHGASVEIILDREGVRAANRHAGEGTQLHRGSSEKIISVQSELREFLDRGGKVYASERWVKTWFTELQPEVKVLNDDEIIDLIFERRGELVNY